MQAGEIIIPITLFISTAVTLILFRKFTNDERLALIEKGMDANIFTRKTKFSFPAIKIGLLLVGAGLGIFVGSIFEGFMGEDAATFSGILFFGGLGLFVSFFIEQKLGKKTQDD